MSQNPINRRDFLNATLTTLWAGFLTACDIKTEVPLTNTLTRKQALTATPQPIVTETP